MSGKKLFKSLSVSLAAFFLIATTVYAASTINITGLLTGAAGDIFNLEGKLKVEKLAVTGNLKANGDLLGDAFKAKNIAYNNTDLDASNVKEALDSLAVTDNTLENLIQQGLGGASSNAAAASYSGSVWDVTVYDVWENTLTETTEINGTPITVTFTPTAIDTGTFESVGLNVFYPYEQIRMEAYSGETFTGTYKIVGNTVLVYGVTPTDVTVGLTAEMKILPNGNITFREMRVAPNAVIVLEPRNLD